jgi:hypothetical protein
MKTPTPSFFRHVVATILFLAVASLAVRAADSPGWAGQFADKKFLGGRAVFQLTIAQSGSAIQVSFDGAYTDAHGAAPEGQGAAKVSGKDTLEFKFEDSFSNAGTGTIKRAGDDIIVSMNPRHVEDPRCLAFYGKNMRLKRAGKK